jgi:hypothetical protein
MKRLVLNIGALVALFSFSIYEIVTTPAQAVAYSIGDVVGSTIGIVWPTNIKPCPVGKTFKENDPPLPKNVPNTTWNNTDFPPVRYRKDTKATVYFEQPNKINADDNDGCDSAVFAYQDGNNIHLPNPCVYPKTDAYARIACHEMGHKNGWPGYHGD